MEKTTFFISDAHLGSRGIEQPEQQLSSLLAFLDHVEDKSADLIIVGDLFDFWFEYKYVIPNTHIELLAKIKSIVKKGNTVRLIAGNHDFVFGDFFRKDLGVIIHMDPISLQIGDKLFYIAHGDGVAKKDGAYRLMKRVFRHPLSITLYKSLHPTLAFAFAHYISGLSRNNRPIKDRDNEYIAYAEPLLDVHDYVIMGHTHRPMEHHRGDKAYINTGDWFRSFTYVKFENGILTLEKWN